MDGRFERTRLLVGDEGIERLARAAVVVFGLGGVGSYAAEAIARAGVGHIVLVDSDCVEVTNLNRQLVALQSTIGTPKVSVARERILQINLHARVETHQTLVTPANAEDFLHNEKACYIDAIDTFPAKLALLELFHAKHLCFVSCMGAASKLDVSGIRVADISDTSNCPLARRIRQQLRKEGILEGIRCVYSQATAIPGADSPQEDPRTRGTISYLPGLIGLTAAGVIINDILAGKTQE
ncbi:MAG TPA: tRNA threonylcarbamoyladenosine dehydratase [Candidatus Hydrogenedentes bacterium]|nr:tRNA threonylcarbamoyladenosine dehydratase [Candidatus Hydrogenedentota bacterium]